MIIYIKELDSGDNIRFIEKIKIKLNCFFIRNIDQNKKIVIISNDITEKKNIKMLKKINKRIQKYKNCKVVLSKKLLELETKINAKIIKGKIIEKALLDKILQFTVRNFKQKDIHILSRKYDLNAVKMTNYFIEKVKTVNIVTNEIQKYKKLEEQIYNEKGIIITLTNNKKKSLKRANVIINLDLNNEEINNYSINRLAIIVNLADTKIDKIAGFEGIVINNVEVDLNEKIREYFIKNNLYSYFEKSALYESISDTMNIETIKEDVKLKEVVGNNGIISYEEIKRCNNTLS